MDKFLQAEIKARRFLDENNLEPPVDVYKLAELLNIEVRKTDFNKEGAMLYKRNKGQKHLVVVKRDKPEPIQRFDIAHESSHILLNHEGKIFRSFACDPQNKPEKEQHADTCASELLIPTPALKREAYKFQHNVRILKVQFRVSEYAMAFKMYRKKLPYNHTQYSFERN